MKAYTDIAQSKDLAKILPLESADMWFANGIVVARNSIEEPEQLNEVFPCWSLEALLEVLNCPTLTQDKIGDGKTGWMVSAYPYGCRYDSDWHDNPIDACVEMIAKLHEIIKLHERELLAEKRAVVYANALVEELKGKQ